MSLSAQDITATILTLPEEEQQEVVDFVEFLKAKKHWQAKQSSVNQENQTHQQTEGERVLAILERTGLLGCMNSADENLSENYKQHLWGSK